MMCQYFAATCVVAEEGGRCVGFATCFIDPKRADCLFVWQVGVAADQRGKGLASRMLLEVLGRPENHKVRFVEATIGPSNKASQALFTGLARRYGTEIRQQGGFTPEMFPGSGHEAEDLYIIGPFDAASPGS
jgi:L-2,4-diaminobutyric acid acetyltransferase